MGRTTTKGRRDETKKRALTSDGMAACVDCMSLSNQNAEGNETKSLGASEARESWDAPQLIPLDLSAARGFFCLKISDKAKDLGPMKCS